MKTVLFLLMFAGVATAMTNRELMDKCVASERVEKAIDTNNWSLLKATDYPDSAYCLGFIDGWMEEVNDEVIQGSDGQFHILNTTTGVSLGQFEKSFMLYMASHPEMEQRNATWGLAFTGMTNGYLTRKLWQPRIQTAVQ